MTINGFDSATGLTLHASSSTSAIHDEHEYAAHNYHPLPVVFARAKGTKVWDPEVRPDSAAHLLYFPSNPPPRAANTSTSSPPTPLSIKATVIPV